MWLVIQLSY